MGETSSLSRDLSSSTDTFMTADDGDQAADLRQRRGSNCPSIHDDSRRVSTASFTMAAVDDLHDEGNPTPRNSMVEVYCLGNTRFDTYPSHNEIQELLDKYRGETQNTRPESSNDNTDDTVSQDSEPVKTGTSGIISVLYAKFIIVIGICFPLAEVITPSLPVSFFNWFYAYLYLTSVLFIIFMYWTVLVPSQTHKISYRLYIWVDHNLKRFKLRRPNCPLRLTCEPQPTQYLKKGPGFYLRIGALIFAFGDMFYCIMEIIGVFDLENNCLTFLDVAVPFLRGLFIAFQVYMVLQHSSVVIMRHRAIVRIGLMHMIATNISLWITVAIKEALHSMHEAHVVGAVKGNNATKIPCDPSYYVGLPIQKLTMFLYPCTVENVLICAGILYTMWTNVGRHCSSSSVGGDRTTIRKKVCRIQCINATHGFLSGLALVLYTLASDFLFYLLLDAPGKSIKARTLVRTVDIVCNVLSFLVLIVAFYQVRKLKYQSKSHEELHCRLLGYAQLGLFMFHLFGILSGAMSLERPTALLVLVSNMAGLLQSTLQSVFLMDVSRRAAADISQVESTTGRGLVAFTSIANFSMWLNTILTLPRPRSNHIQVEFYGFWAWTIINHITSPLVIFYRFHSFLALGEVWKRVYKVPAHHFSQV